jgi:LysM repeat protein
MNPRLTRALKNIAFVFAAFLPLLLASCSSSSGGVKGVPAQLPHIPIHASASTPSHSMSRGDYPFDAGGNYVTAWAAEGAGRSGLSAGIDYTNWRSSHNSEGSSRKTTSSRSSSSSSRGKTTKSSSTKSKTVAKSSTKSKPKAAASTRHTVKKGDTLSAIARRYGTSVAKIKAANGMKSDMIRDGKTLVVPK